MEFAMFQNAVSSLLVRHLLSLDKAQAHEFLREFARTSAGRLVTAWCIALQMLLVVVCAILLPKVTPTWFTFPTWWSLPLAILGVLAATHALTSSVFAWFASRRRAAAGG
jgi:hypothetical protein